MYKVSLSESAYDFFISSDKNLSQKLDRCFVYLKSSPYRSNNIKRLTGKWLGYFRYRIGDYRVIYKVDEKNKSVVVRLIEHRSEVYK